MLATAETIDFLRDDVGEWFLIYFFGAAFAIVPRTKLKFKYMKQGGWRDVFKKCLFSFLVGMLLAVPISFGLAIWQRLGQQYFIKLQLEENQIVLVNRWPKSALTIPLDKVLSVSLEYERHGIKTRGCNRMYVRTVEGTFASYGFGNFNEGETAVFNKLTNVISSQAIFRQNIKSKSDEHMPQSSP